MFPTKMIFPAVQSGSGVQTGGGFKMPAWMKPSPSPSAMSRREGRSNEQINSNLPPEVDARLQAFILSNVPKPVAPVEKPAWMKPMMGGGAQTGVTRPAAYGGSYQGSGKIGSIPAWMGAKTLNQERVSTRLRARGVHK
jgi:hypothetical protein